MKFPIVEIFTSIQGEGINLGKAANFVRFAGCNLTCPWCDTEWKKPTETLTREEIVARLDPNVKLVVLTGGEPLMQKELLWLVIALTDAGYRVAVETNGTYPTDALRKACNIHVACSPKPQSNWSIHENCHFDELKYVVDDSITVDNIKRVPVPVWLQPEGGNMREAWKKAIQLQKEILSKSPHADVRIGVQLHKVMEVR